MFNHARILAFLLAICLLACTANAASLAIDGFFIGQTLEDILRNCSEKGYKTNYENNNRKNAIDITGSGKKLFTIGLSNGIAEKIGFENFINQGMVVDNIKYCMVNGSFEYNLFLTQIKRLVSCRVYESRTALGPSTYIASPGDDWAMILLFSGENAVLHRAVLGKRALMRDMTDPAPFNLSRSEF